MHPYTKPLIEILTKGFDGFRSTALAATSVAVIDSGVDASHPALRGRVSHAFVVQGDALLALDATANNDCRGHGTAVADLIARTAPNATLVDIRALRSDATGDGAEFVQAFQHALEMPVGLINMSLTVRPRWRDAIHGLCERAHRQNIAVIAAQNGAQFVAAPGLPAGLASVIGVDLHFLEGLLTILYRHRSAIEFAAAGERIAAAAAGGGYSEVTGSSFATPIVTGLCAVLRGAYPELRPYELKAILKALAHRHVHGTGNHPAGD
jgi:subtilisin family serine protease